MNNQKKSLFLQGAALLFAAVAAMGIFCLSFRYDNKYQTRTPQPVGGILMLSREDLSSGRPIYLINGWEYYYGQLLTPDEVQKPDILPNQYVSIGQYAGLEAGNALRPPHGSATYRLQILLPETPDTYTLELPEIYSAYRLYINGQESQVTGNPDPDSYEPQIHMGSVTFTAGGQAELLFAVSDRSHFYSGLVYPPAFGKTAVVSSFLTQRFACYLFYMSLAVLLGGYQLILSVTLKSRRSFLFALICAAFAAGISSPVIHSLAATAVWPYYGIELFCRYMFFGLSAVLVSHLCGLTGRLLWISSFAACSFPFAACAVFLASSRLSYRQMALFSLLASGYKAACAAFMAWAIFRAAKRQVRGSFLLLAAITVLAVSLAADRLLPLFEPMRFGWFSETAGLCFLLLLAVRLWMETAAAYRRQIVLEEEKARLTETLSFQKSYYQTIAAQVEAAQTIRHDLRHHLHAVRNLLSGQDADKEKVEKAAAYIDRLSGSPALTAPIRFCSSPALDAVVKYYYGAAMEAGTSCTIELAFPEPLFIDEQDLCVILGNLLENAVEACARVPAGKRFIRLCASFQHDNVLIELHNASLAAGGKAEGVAGSEAVATPGLADSPAYPSSKAHGRRGIGLASVKALASKYGGELWLRNTNTKDGIDEFVTEVFLLNRS